MMKLITAGCFTLRPNGLVLQANWGYSRAAIYPVIFDQAIHMNRFDAIFGLKGEARVKYLDGDFHVIVPGDFVLCAVSGARIPLPDLRYWNVELQEPYASAAISLQRHIELKKTKSKP